MARPRGADGAVRPPHGIDLNIWLGNSDPTRLCGRVCNPPQMCHKFAHRLSLRGSVLARPSTPSDWVSSVYYSVERATVTSLRIVYRALPLTSSSGVPV